MNCWSRTRCLGKENRMYSAKIEERHHFWIFRTQPMTVPVRCFPLLQCINIGWLRTSNIVWSANMILSFWTSTNGSLFGLNPIWINFRFRSSWWIQNSSPDTPHTTNVRMLFNLSFFKNPKLFIVDNYFCTIQTPPQKNSLEATPPPSLHPFSQNFWDETLTQNHSKNFKICLE